ncbi:MAG TPA: hypothetical protein VN930_06530 [Xanthobacteraceae bacterium]|jgi:hypothetical protein|nr:hypothetical protein [Xanthobacteraceae bacterium]
MGIHQQITVIALALGLAGCVASKAPLFDPASAVTPVAAGRFEIQEEKGGTWTRSGTGALKLEGRVYTWKVDDDEKIQRFSLHDVGGGYFVLMTPPEGSQPVYYTLFEKSDQGWLAYGPLCSDLRKVRAIADAQPLVEGTDCYYADRAKLARALIAYSKVMLPGARYIAAKP